MIPHPVLKLLSMLVMAALIIWLALDPTVQVALIVSVSGIINGAVLWKLNHLTAKVGLVAEKVDVVEKNTNSKLSQLLDERNTATTRADKSEAHAEGIKDEQDRTKP
jgi:hypothetical protein